MDADLDKMLGKPKLSLNAMLGLPEVAELERLVLDAVRAADPEEGVSMRSMAKRHPHVGALTWADTLASLNERKVLRQWWGLCRDGGGATLHEGRYAIAPVRAP